MGDTLKPLDLMEVYRMSFHVTFSASMYHRLFCPFPHASSS
jgi:hypothetical protein